jgi:hypothetical protein
MALEYTSITPTSLGFFAGADGSYLLFLPVRLRIAVLTIDQT